MFEEIRDIKSGRKELREFGLTVGIIFIILGSIALWRGKQIYLYLLIPGILLVFFGLIHPAILKPLQKIWMSFSIVIGFFMSHIILSVLFYLVLTPIGLVMRLFGKDILDQRIEKNKISYWKDIENKVKPKESYERQY